MKLSPLEQNKQGLWIKFKSKIESDWSVKYDSFGSLDRFFPGQVSINFAKALQKDMIRSFSEMELDITPLNHQTLYNYFHADGLPKNVKTGTLDTLSKYLGFRDWENFQKENEKHGNEKDLVTPSPQKSFSFQRSHFFIVALLIAAVAYLAFTQIASDHINEEDKAIIGSTLEKANKLQFKLYCDVPDLIDTIMLNSYYTSSGEARAVIMKVLQRRSSLNSQLDLDASKIHINYHDIIFKNRTHNQVEVETVEYWNLIWKDTSGLEDASYENVNRQTYLFKNVEGDWKIEENVYY